uniref:hypothetical protein n=1 Tax=Limosilactobacillus reuteri TaxID=1598 RepID=UPI003D80D5B7
MRQGVVKYYGNANPCTYRMVLKEWLEVSVMLHTILLLTRIFRVIAEEVFLESGRKPKSNPDNNKS